MILLSYAITLLSWNTSIFIFIYQLFLDFFGESILRVSLIYPIDAHVSYWKNSSIYTIKTVLNFIIDTSKSAAEAFGIDKYYGTTEELAQDLEIGTVVVSVKVPLHKCLIRPAISPEQYSIVPSLLLGYHFNSLWCEE